MSFSGTPLGQGRRLDHHTFLKGGSATQLQPNLPNSPPRRVPSINSIPLSYAYGAPTLNRSPGKGANQTSPRAPRNTSPSSRSAAGTSQGQSQQLEAEDDGERVQDEIASARYARLKQRNQALASRPGSSLGPGIITTPPQPTPASFKDTSVNVASAFNLAADSYNAMPSQDTQSRAYLPRSTSVEYEAQAQSTSHRRLAVPPNRVGSKSSGYTKPGSKTSSRVDSSLDQSADSVDSTGRAKSPFDHLAELTRRAVSPAVSAVYLLRQRSQEPDERPPAISKSATEKTLVGDAGESYDYQDEEAEFQKSLKSTSKRTQNTTANHKRGRMSVDNKAYHPSDSELESESEDELDDGKRRRRKAKKKDTGGGPLNTLPVAGYDKRKKKKGRGKGGAEDEASFSDEHVSEQRSATPGTARPGSKPPSRAGSVLRQNTILENDTSGGGDASVDIEQGLEPISEAEETQQETDNQIDPNSSSEASNVSASHAPAKIQSSAFSIGAFFGSIVNFGFRIGHVLAVGFLRLLAMCALLVGRVLGTTVDIGVRRPFRFAKRSRGMLGHIAKYLLVALALFGAWYALQHPSVRNISLPFSLPFPTSRPVVQWGDIPPDSIENIIARIVRVENTMADMRTDTTSSQARMEQDVRKIKDTATKVNKLESQMDKESLRAMRAEEEYRLASAKNYEALRKEMKALEQQIEQVGSKAGQPGTVEGLDEVKAHVRLLGERLSTAEVGVQEALDTGKKLQTQVGNSKAEVGNIPSWWTRVGSSSSAQSGLTIKSTDGQDVTALIETLADRAVARAARDDVGKTDWAMASAGASVIPSLTSLPIALDGKRGMLSRLLGGKSPAMSPVVALHHETHLGHCWPIEGSVGQLGVKLARRVFPSEVTIDHVPKEIAVDIGSAPREMEVWGLVEGKDNLARYQAWVEQHQASQEGSEGENALPEQPRSLPANAPYMRLSSFAYDVDAPGHIQTFPMDAGVRELGIDFGVVVLMVKSNWGQEEFTCVYRFRLHGEQFQQQPPAPAPPAYEEVDSSPISDEL